MLRLARLLGLGTDASGAALKQAYKQTVLRCHPDTCAGSASCDKFIAVQTAWEDYSRGCQKPSRGAAGSAEASGLQPDDQMVLLVMQMKAAWLDPPSLEQHNLRSAITTAVNTRGQQLHSEGFPACDVRRIEVNGPRVEVHVHASGPSHREAICAMIDGGDRAARSAFMDTLLSRLDSVGWPVAEAPLMLKACLPYTLPIPPAPAAVSL